MDSCLFHASLIRQGITVSKNASVLAQHTEISSDDFEEIGSPEHTNRSVLAKKAGPSRRKKWLVSFVAVTSVLAACVGLVYWKVIRVQAVIAAHSVEPPPIEVVAAKATTSTLPQYLETIGTIKAIETVQISTEIAGRVVWTALKSGNLVEKDELLVQLDDSIEQAQLKSAVARVELAKLQVQRTSSLLASRVESRQNLDQRQSELAQAEAAVAELNARIAQKSIKAPFGGRVGLTDLSVGSFANPGTALATLTALDRLHVEFAVPQQELEKIAIGRPLALTTDAWPGERFNARVSAVDSSVDPTTRTLRVQAELERADERLRPGLFVEVRVELPAQTERLVVAQTAVQSSATGDMMYVIKDDKAQPVSVTTGQRMDDEIVVETGLQEGDIYVVTGQLRLYPGATVATNVATADK